MKKTIWALFALSLAANAWLWSRRDLFSRDVSQAPSRETTPTGTSAGATKSAAEIKAAAGAAAARAHRAKLITTLATMDSNDIVNVRDRLRAEGADETLIYGLIDGILRHRFDQALREAELVNLRTGWWRGTPARGANAPSWSKLTVAPLFQTLGPDPMDIVDFSSRFDFLPAEKAKRLAKIATDYDELRMRALDTSDAQALKMVEDERQKDVMNLLTPEERAEYDLRFSEVAVRNAQRYTRMQVTEKEFRAIQPLVEQLQQESAALPRDQNAIATSRSLEQKTFDQIVAAIGYDRAIDYLWSGTTLTGRNSLSLAMTTMPSPPYAGQVLQLAAETGAAAAAIHSDPSRSSDQKRAALIALQQATQPKLDQILPGDTRANLDPQALAWFNGLGKGQYMLVTPRLIGDVMGSSQPISVTGPMRGTPPPILSIRASK